MWVAKFKLKDTHDAIYTPLCKKYKIEFHANTHANYLKDNKLHFILSGVISGSTLSKQHFLSALKKNSHIVNINQHKDFLLIHATYPPSRESEAQLSIFYDPQYIHVTPVHVSSDGWKYWDVACLDRGELNKLVNAAITQYDGKLLSMKKELIKNIATTRLSPGLTDKQLGALLVAFKEGYYHCPRKLTLPELAKISKKSYSTFQEHLSKAENKLIDFFIKYR